jgi:DNA replication protein DnaC
MQSYEKHLSNICYGNPPKILHSINIRTNFHSICFLGASGSGKTFIASVLVQSAIRKNLTAKYYDWTDIVQLLTDFDKKKEIDELVEELKNIDFVCIDGIENFNISNPYLILQLDRISKSRLNSGKPYMLFGNGEIERISNGSGWQSLISNCLSIRLPHAIKKS